MFKLDWSNILSAFVYGILSFIVLAILAILGYILKVGNIFGIDWKAMVNEGIIAGIAGFVAGVSIIKNLLTSSKGNFIGVVPVIPDKK